MDFERADRLHKRLKATCLGAIVLGSGPALALTGRRCVPTRLLAEGFEFSVPDFEGAVAKALRARPP